MTVVECRAGRMVRHRLGQQKLIVVNTHSTPVVGGVEWWVRTRDANLRMYDMNSEELEPDESVAGT